ncbi:helix-turn-helix domain-containing protein [Serratia sp. Lou2A]|uniref:Helix-turn-helix domain-containing protein n=1 Tax=Serratia montpellierensis TaxID=2598730 RepID=A0ABS8J7A5_9GAMM|nr:MULTISPECIES: helix-turn-helix domain-containing protein [Serratia]MBX9335678.1 helix-turn-helix domain-containing protein [Serratia marcescens]MCC7586174.1 helix-turn-helix domain-containing protein [Serratia sp. Lou2A]MCC7659881.1 helix-turn-helix domain-containing protein [Serratia sp. Pon4B]MDP8610431.1 helix-turn-helix domain-containing protein [Serratia marcescens]MDP8680084.1 helix-turn-helix domain-containing protein [Serratia marcescens]
MKGKNHQIEHPQIRRLNELMTLKGISKAEMARIAGVSPQSVNNWFLRGTVGKNSALKLSEALGVSVAWLLGEDVDENTGLAPSEVQMLELFRQLPPAEQERMIDLFQLRLKEIDDYVEKYLRGRYKPSEE